MLFGLFDEAEHVAHAQDAARHPVRVEDVEVFEFLAGGGEHDRPAGDLTHRQRRTTAGVAVEFGEHDAGESDARLERLGRGDRVLTDHRVDDEQDLVRVGGLADVGGLPHQLLVDTEAAGGVDDHHVVVLGHRLVDTGPRHRHRIAGADAENTLAADAGPRMRREHRHSGSFADDLQLRDRAGTLQVTGHQQRGVTLLLEPVTELAGQGGLTRALQAGEHDDRRRLLGELHAPGLTAEDPDEFLVDDLDDLLGRVEGGRHLCTLGALLDLGDEPADHRQRDVGFEQRQADLAGGPVDVGVGQSAFAAQILQGTGQPVGEGIEHFSSVPCLRPGQLIGTPEREVPPVVPCP